MKKVIIKNPVGIQTHRAEMEDPTAWIAECVASNAWGKPERWVLHKDESMAESYDEADVLEEKTEEHEMRSVKMVKLKAEYTIEIEDITAKVEQEKINSEALAYLASTDWLIIREVDSGVSCPEEIKIARAEARAKVIREQA